MDGVILRSQNIQRPHVPLNHATIRRLLVSKGPCQWADCFAASTARSPLQFYVKAGRKGVPVPANMQRWQLRNDAVSCEITVGLVGLVVVPEN